MRPDNAPLLHSGIATEYPEEGHETGDDTGGGGAPTRSFKEAHPIWRPHLLQGWAPDFIPRLVRDAVDAKSFDDLMHVGGDRAMQVARELAQKEGIFTGTSGGGVLACALEVAKAAPKGSRVLAMLPDTGERYLSTPLFADVPSDMTEEEKAIAESTPSQPPPPATLPPVTEEATAFVKDFIGAHKVAIFSLEYCEFCWTIFRFFDAIGVKYDKLNVDAFEFAQGNMGNKYRAALQELTDCKPFPILRRRRVPWRCRGRVHQVEKGRAAAAAREGGPQGGRFQRLRGRPVRVPPQVDGQNPLRSK